MQKKQPVKKYLLNLLDRRFEGRLRAPQVETFIPQESVKTIDTLFDRGILLRGRVKADRIVCPLGFHDGSGLIDADQRSDGSYHGLCVEHGQLVTLQSDQAEWVEFSAAAWADAVRSANGLIGDSRLLADGLYLLGLLQTVRRKVMIVAVSGRAFVESLDSAARNFGTQATIYLDCGNRSVGHSAPKAKAIVVNASDLLDETLIRFRPAVLAKILADVFVESAPPSYFPFEKYTAGSRKGTPLSVNAYERELAQSKRADLFIDVSKSTVWRGGKQILYMAGGKKRAGKRKSISKTGLLLLAYYIKRPHVPILPIRAEPYAGSADDSREARSAQVMLLNMRKTLNLDAILKTGANTSGEPGNCSYSFEPTAKFRYVLITPVSQTAE